MRTHQALRGTVAALLVVPLLTGIASLNVRPAAAVVTPVANPPIADSCGVDVTVVLDASGSVQSSDAVEEVRGAAEALLDALKNTNSSARVTQFATLTQQLAPRTSVDDATLASGRRPHGTPSTRYYNPQPPRPAGTSIRRYDGSGNPLSGGQL